MFPGATSASLTEKVIEMSPGIELLALLWVSGLAGTRTKRLNLGDGEQPQVTPNGVQPIEENKSRWGESLVDTKEEVPKGWRGMVGS